MLGANEEALRTEHVEKACVVIVGLSCNADGKEEIPKCGLVLVCGKMVVRGDGEKEEI